MSTRTYCVIPHEARQDTLFQGVFEDGVRVLYRGRLQSLVFSHVLSPAHDYVKHINGPLLATLRDGGNATLVLATPNSEDMALSPKSTASEGNRSTSQIQANARATTSRVASSSVLVQKPNTGLAAAKAVVMELYTQLFPLLFRNLEGCSTAQLSVVTVSASERVLLDNFCEDHRIRTPQEAHRKTLTRTTSATEWGTLLQFLEDRHAAVEESPGSVEGQTACVVTVELQGYGRLVVVDAASAQDLLQQLTLILHMQADGAARTYPLHVPLRDLLENNVAPHATVQVLCVPAPQDTVRQTMRVLHFAATVEAAQSSGVAPGLDASVSMPRYSRPLHRRRMPLSPAPSKLFSRSATSATSSSMEENPTHRKGSASSPRPAVMQSALALDVVGGAKCGSTSSSASGFRERTPARLPLPNVQLDRDRQRVREQHLLKRIAALEEQLRNSEEQCHSAKAACDQAVQERDKYERELRGKASLSMDLQRIHQATKKRNADYAQLVEKLAGQVHTLQRAAARQRGQGAAVVKQLRQVEAEKEELTKQLTRLRKEVLLFRKEAICRARRTTQWRIAPIEATVPSFQASEQRLPLQPQNVRQTMSSSVSSAPASAEERNSPRARRIYDSTSHVEAALGTKDVDTISPAEEQQAHLAAITVDELRWRNYHLVQEVDRLQERLLAALSAAAKREATEGTASDLAKVERHEGGCLMCGRMQERVEWFQKRLADVLHEKDALQHPTATSSAPFPPGVSKTTDAANLERSCSSSTYSRSPSFELRGHNNDNRNGLTNRRSTSQPAQTSPTNTTQSVAAALLTGCASLSAQLACAHSELARRLLSDASASKSANSELFEPLSQLSPLILHEHQEAVSALADSLRRIAERPASRPATRGSAAFPISVRDAGAVVQPLLPPVPRCATAADADTLTNYLSFETERCQHLRAFIPSFAQLAVATEHIAMRLETTNEVSNSRAE
ncbi:hypothetical protein JKF63_02572 [Porcisia hertigi]|uniref:Uncharacterized protein n=1 Tax=Porcisia hertigi TaxID=2761500 RepID=A0A836IF75_9TRYP|nr:hypothetical protein JKF63_02572 [Porcisia hertigi]